MLFTTMVSHRPVMMVTSRPIPAPATDNNNNNNNVPQPQPPQPRTFRATAARDSTDRSINNPNNPAPSTLRLVLTRSTQPTFSVSAMFGVRSGGGCGACGH
jgi:hypothetical protein